jgi:hypothetical protein
MKSYVGVWHHRWLLTVPAWLCDICYGNSHLSLIGLLSLNITRYVTIMMQRKQIPWMFRRTMSVAFLSLLAVIFSYTSRNIKRSLRAKVITSLLLPASVWTELLDNWREYRKFAGRQSVTAVGDTTRCMASVDLSWCWLSRSAWPFG